MIVGLERIPHNSCLSSFKLFVYGGGFVSSFFGPIYQRAFGQAFAFTEQLTAHVIRTIYGGKDIRKANTNQDYMDFVLNDGILRMDFS